jgi:hypothetical protein
MRQRDNAVNAKAPARRCRCTSAATPKRKSGDSEKQARQCRGVCVAMSRHYRRASGVLSRRRYFISVSPATRA